MQLHILPPVKRGMLSVNSCLSKGWSGGAIVLGKLPVPGRLTDLDKSKARANCACNRCGWGLFGHSFSRLSFSLLSPSLWEILLFLPLFGRRPDID